MIFTSPVRNCFFPVDIETSITPIIQYSNTPTLQPQFNAINRELLSAPENANYINARLQIYLISLHFAQQGWMADFEQPGSPGAIAPGFLERPGDQIFFHNFLGALE